MSLSPFFCFAVVDLIVASGEVPEFGGVGMYNLEIQEKIQKRTYYLVLYRFKSSQKSKKKTDFIIMSGRYPWYTKVADAAHRLTVLSLVGGSCK